MIRKMATLIPPQAVKKLADLYSAECRTKIVTTGAPEGAFVDADMVRGCRGGEIDFPEGWFTPYPDHSCVVASRFITESAVGIPTIWTEVDWGTTVRRDS